MSQQGLQGLVAYVHQQLLAEVDAQPDADAQAQQQATTAGSTADIGPLDLMGGVQGPDVCGSPGEVDAGLTPERLQELARSLQQIQAEIAEHEFALRGLRALEQLLTCLVRFAGSGEGER